MLDAKRSATEIQATVKDAKTACDNLGSKHDEYMMFLLRVTAYVMRFCRNVHIKSSHKSNEEMTLGLLTADEIKRSEKYWLKTTQSNLVRKMKDGELKSLTPFFHSEGIIRVGGRIDQVQLSYNEAHPALLL